MARRIQSKASQKTTMTAKTKADAKAKSLGGRGQGLMFEDDGDESQLTGSMDSDYLMAMMEKMRTIHHERHHRKKTEHMHVVNQELNDLKEEHKELIIYHQEAHSSVYQQTEKELKKLDTETKKLGTDLHENLAEAENMFTKFINEFGEWIQSKNQLQREGMKTLEKLEESDIEVINTTAEGKFVIKCEESSSTSKSKSKPKAKSKLKTFKVQQGDDDEEADDEEEDVQGCANDNDENEDEDLAQDEYEG